MLCCVLSGQNNLSLQFSHTSSEVGTSTPFEEVSLKESGRLNQGHLANEKQQWSKPGVFGAQTCVSATKL